MPVIRGRAGFTLVELMIVVVLLGIVGAVTVRMLTDAQRLTVAQGERAQLQSTNRTGAIVLPVELREVNPALGDITFMSADTIRYRGMRNFGVTCLTPTATTAVVLASSVGGLRGFANGDSVLVFVEGDVTTLDDDRWAKAVIAAAPVTAAAVCPGSLAGTTLVFSTAGGGMRFDDDNTAVTGLQNGAVIRAFTHTRLGTYISNGRTWLGMAANDDAFEPLIGPLMADSGLNLVYRDRLGNVTNVATNVRSIDVTIRGEASREVHTKGTGAPQLINDSLVTRVTLRNGL